jgi:N-acetylmuramoyl-L-alanine amidase CwlA
MKIEEKYISSSLYSVKSPYSMTPQYITIHNTANDASADNEYTYMTKTNASSTTGWHIVVDDVKAIYAVPLNRNSWHSGDGGTGTGNRKSIGIEICYSKSGGSKYTQAEENCVQLVASLLKKYGWGIDRIKKHQDWSGKYCPHRILDEGRWDSFKNRIAKAIGSTTTTLTSTSTTSTQDYTGVITYQVYCNGKWQSPVNKCDNTSNGYAGIYGKPINGFRCKPQYGEIIYEAHQLGGKWLGAVNSKDYSSGKSNSYAGIYGKPIDGIRIKSTKGYVDYRVHIKGGSWLDWARGFGDSGNLYAGIYGKEIDGIQMK